MQMSITMSNLYLVMFRSLFVNIAISAYIVGHHKGKQNLR